MKGSLFLASCALVAACAASTVYAHDRAHAQRDPVVEQCVHVTNRIADVVSVLQPIAAIIPTPITVLKNCMSAGRIMVSMTSIPLPRKVPRQHGTESNAFSGL